MNPALPSLLIASALVAGTAVGLSPAAPVPETLAALPDIFRNDVRLQAPLTLAMKDRPLGEVLATLGKQISARLSASRDTAEDKATLFVEKRPAAEVLSLLARQFRFRWARVTRGYELGQDAAETAREAARRDADREAEWTELRAWTERLHHLIGTPRNRLQERAAEIDRLLKGMDLAAAERARLTTEAAAVRDALRPQTASAIALLRSLTPAQVAQLRKNRNLLLSGEHGSLSPRILEHVRRTPVDEEVFRRPVDIPELQVWADEMVAWWEGLPVDGPPHRGMWRSSFGVELVVRREVDGKQEWGSVPWAPRLPARERAVASTTRTDDPTLNRLVTLDLSKAGRPGARVPQGSASVLTHARSRWPAWPTLGDVAEALHQATGLEVLADSFVRYRVDPKWISEPKTAARLLDTLAHELEYTWRKEGNLLLLRSRTAHWDRAMEVPERVIRPWQQRAARPETKPLDAYAELVTALDDLQVLGMSTYWGWYLEEPWVGPPGGSASELHAARRHLRFWAGLTPSQREAAHAGAVVPAARMSDGQRRAFVTALTDPVASPWDPEAAFLVSGRTLSPADILSGGFSLKTAVEWNHQLFEGEKAGEERSLIVAQYPTYRPPNLANLPQDYRWSMVGPPCAREDLSFGYHLARDQKPARTAKIGLLRPRAGR